MNNQVEIRKDDVLGKNRRIEILDTIVDVLTTQQTIELVEQYIKTKTSLHLMGVNADKINEMKRNNRLKQIVNNCGVINADGASVVLASRFLKKPLPERVAGIDLMQELIGLSQKKGYKVYLLGAKQEVVQKTAKVLSEDYSEVKIVGVHNGYFTECEWKSLSEEIKELNPDIVFVGITSPLKEYLVDFMQKDGNNCVFMGVGGSFDVLSGNIKRAPIWMQRSNLEWLFRMMKEPRRLGKRYMIGNITFICSVLKEKIKKRKGEKNEMCIC